MSRSLALAGLVTLTLTLTMTSMSSAASAQTSAPLTVRPTATRTGHDLNISVQHYDYTEPPPVDISIHGPKFGAEYTGTFALRDHGPWFAQFNLRGTGAIARYDGNCRPWQIAPDSTSPNGYRLTLGVTSPCSETGDADWYVDGRALVRRDFYGDSWAISPFIGVGGRYLSNGTTGNFNYRTEEYAYVPVGGTVRAGLAHLLSLTVEYDHLLRGWNTTRNSVLTGGTVPATSTTPSFSIGDFTDLSFTQHRGHALRASAAYQLSRSWSIEPYYVRWRVSSSPLSDGSVAFTVNNITARQTFSYYEPLNVTSEFGVKVGVHFGR